MNNELHLQIIEIYEKTGMSPDEIIKSLEKLLRTAKYAQEDIINKAKWAFESMSDSESVAHQLKHWVDGIPLHNTVRDECCPDFSCCSGGEIIPIDIRKRFEKAVNDDDKSAQWEILGMALSAVFADKEVDVHIAGENPTKN
jgi:hypothetical protein